MGVVYKARDTRLGRTVALKFLPPQWSHDEDAKQRFVREAQAASATDHRNICTIHDIATSDDGQLFIVMAYYEGVTLKQRLEAGPLPIDEALDIATQVAEGLARAHAQGVVHRDIKPGNIILAEDGVRILDFGLATFVDALQLTVAGSTLGTAPYMSPEQVKGEAADASTDVWAAGVILYQMLAGHVPFRGAYAEAIAHAIRNETPAPIRAARPEVPEEVEQIVFRALHKDASVRYPSGRELARALRQARGQTVPMDLRTQEVVTPAGAVPPMRRLSRRPLWLGAAAILVAILAGAAWVMRPVARTPIVIVPVANQTGFPELDQYRRALTLAIVDRLTDSRSIRPSSWALTIQTLHRFGPEVDLSSREVVQGLENAAGARMSVLPTLFQSGGQWRIRVDIRDPAQGVTIATYESDPIASALRKETARDLAVEAAALVQAHFDRGWLAWVFKWNPEVPRPWSLDAGKAMEEGLAWQEEQEYARAHEAFERAAALAPQNALAAAWASRAARSMRRADLALSAAATAARLIEDSTAAIDRLFVEAIVAEARGEYAAAEARYRGLMERHPDDVRWAIEMAAFEARRAENKEGWSKAVSAFLQAQAIDAGPIRPRLELCQLYNRLQEPLQAKEQGRLALTRYQQAGWRSGEAHARFCLVDAYRLGPANERNQAEDQAKQALAILEQGGFTYSLPRALYYLGLTAGEQGRNADALSHWERATRAAEEGGNLALRATTLNNIGVVYHRMGSGSRAADYYGQSAALYEELGDERGAARQLFNSASLRVTYGVGAEKAIDELNAALTVISQRGDPDFEIACLEAIGAQHRHLGQYGQAEQAFNRALNLAAQSSVAQKTLSIRLQLARLRFDESRYGDAKSILDQIVGEASGSVLVQVRLALGRTLTRLGDFSAAARHLDAVRTEVESRRDSGLEAAINEAQGQLAFESGELDRATSLFAAAAPFGSDPFVDPPAVEAAAYLGLLRALQGRHSDARDLLEKSLAHARRMKRVTLEQRCRLMLARFYLLRGDMAAARQTIGGADQSESNIGPELRAQLLHWRSRVTAGTQAGAYQAQAVGLVRQLEMSLPETARSQFLGRSEIRLVLENARVRY